MPSGLYNRFKSGILEGVYKMASGANTYKTALMTATHSFDPSTVANTGWADVSANEIAPTGDYVAGGQAITTQQVIVDNANNRGIYDGDDVQWNGDISAANAVIYDDTNVGKDLVGSIDFGGTETSVGAPFTIVWSSDGIARIN